MATRWYIRASQAVDRRNAYRLSAVARLAAIYESKREFGKAMAAYQDIASYSKDRELAQAAAGRATQLRSSRTTR